HLCGCHRLWPTVSELQRRSPHLSSGERRFQVAPLHPRNFFFLPHHPAKASHFQKQSWIRHQDLRANACRARIPSAQGSASSFQSTAELLYRLPDWPLTTRVLESFSSALSQGMIDRYFPRFIFASRAFTLN